MFKREKGLRKIMAMVIIVAVVLSSLNLSAFAYTMDYNFTGPQDPGWPTFSGNTTFPEPVAYTPGRMMQAIYDEEESGTSFWMDRMLGTSGSAPDTNDLFSKGRMLTLVQHNPAVMGFSGEARYGDRVNDPGKNIYTVTLSSGTFTENSSMRRNYPSYFSTEFNASNINVKETKFITYNNVAVTLLTIKNNGTAAQNITVTATSPYATTASGSELISTVQAPLLWTGSNPNYIPGITNCNVRMSGDSMSISGSNLVRTISVGAGQTVQTKVVLGWTAAELPESTTEYNTYKAYTNDTAFSTHVKTYNQWWSDNIPYIDIPDPYIKKVLYYRWWNARFNSIDGNIPGNDWQFPSPVEGILGYSNQITCSLAWIMDDIKYLRNPIYSYGTMLQAGEVSRDGAYRDNPARGWMWNKVMMQYISRAGWDSYKVHGGPTSILNNFSKYTENDINAQFNIYDQNNNKLIAYSDSTLTANDGCTPSMNYYSTDGSERNTDRIDASSYNWGNTVAAAQMYNYMGNTSKASTMNTLANTIQTNFMNTFWDETSKQFRHYDTAAAARSPWKDNNFNGYWMGIIPTTDSKYSEMFKLFNNSGDYNFFPFFTGDYNDITARYNRDKNFGTRYAAWYGNTFGFCNAGVNLSVLAAGLKKYPNSYINTDSFKKTLYWDAWLHCIQDGNVNFLDENEFFWLENANNDTKVNSTMSQTGRIVRSWIHHNQLSKMTSNVIEDVMGFTPRSDKQVELWPIDIGWDHFTVNGLKYHGSDVTVVWDKPGDGTTWYSGIPEGYSLYVDGSKMFTINALKHVIWDSQTGSVTFPEGGATASYNVANASFKEPKEVSYSSDSRMQDIFQKAGRDISTATDIVNLAENKAGTGYPTPTASYTASGKNIWSPLDGYTIANPIWGALGSSNSQDWYQINFGSTKTINNAKVYFYNDRCSPGYSEPASYTIQYLNGSTWTDVPTQTKSPAAPVANYNNVTFPNITAQNIRILMTHKSGTKAGIKEVQVFGTTQGNQAPAVEAGNNQTITLPASATLAGTATDDGLPTGSSLTYAWTKSSGSGTVTFANASSLSTTATFSAAGTYVLQLTASDGTLSTSDTVTITVNAASTTNTAPVVNAGADATITLPSTATLTGTATDDGLPTGSTLTHTWSLVSGAGTATIANTNSLSTTATVSAAGTYVFQLTASDGTLSTSDTVTITVNAENPNTDGYVVNYAFNETSGTTAADASGNGNSGTVNNGCTWTTGKDGNAISLSSSSSQYVSIPTGVVSGLTNFTIAGWVKPNSINSWARIFDFGTGTSNYMFLTTSAGGSGLRYAITTSGNGSEQTLNYATGLTAGAWTHVAVTLSGSTGTMYVNGAPVATNTSMTLNPSSLGSTTQNYIGKSQFSGDAYYNGLVDDFKIYNKALSATEVSALYGTTTINVAPVVSAGSAATVTLPSTATLTGTASDDGLPTGSSLTYDWTKVSGTGTVTFGNASTLSTTASFSEAGTYVLQLTVSDGTLSTSDTVTITVNAASTTTSNVALTATSTTSYCSSWETLTAVNDGYTPSSSADTTHGQYGNWSNHGTTQWVQYDFTQDYTISSTNVYWFKDSEVSAGGVCTPTSCTFQYWDATTSAWVDVANGSGHGVAADTFNTTTFTPVTTTKFRVNITAQSTASTGIIEWQVFGY